MPVLERWDTDPNVIAATTDDDATERAFGDLDWREELGQDSDVSDHLIAEVDGRPVGAVQVCDPHVEPTHYGDRSRRSTLYNRREVVDGAVACKSTAHRRKSTLRHPDVTGVQGLC